MSGPLRTVLAVLLAGALLTVGLAAAERAAETRTATRLEETTSRLAGAADRLAARNDPTRTGAARRTLTVRVPRGGAVRIDNGSLRWRVDEGAWHRRRQRPSVTILTAGRLTLPGGRHRLQLSLRLHDGAPVVNATRRPGG